MLKSRKATRAIALCLLLIFATNTFAPTAAYALTSGPTSPEATSFEPIDTTDLVDIQTGDFTYNIPLLEVPGPEGGYPLSLSYHAGIQPNEDASWVGLGWTLNPGAISRFVNGYADDWYTPTGAAHTYWEGGTTKTFNIGVTIGIANSPATVSFGLSFSSDTYRGFGVGFSMGFGSTIGGEKSPFGFTISFGVDPYGAASAGGKVSAGVPIWKGDHGKTMKASVGLGVSTNFESLNVGVSAGVGYTIPQEGKQAIRGSLLGISMSTGSKKATLSVAGITTSASATKEAGIKSKKSGFSADIPTPWGFSVSLGWSKRRYWTDETATTTMHGGLYGSGWGQNASDYSVYDNVGYDTYSLLEDHTYLNMIDNGDPTKVQGGAFPDFDMYAVNAQGLGGVMRPYLFQGEVLGQNKKTSSNVPIVTYHSPGVTNYTPSFRFAGDFSNSYRQNYPDYSDPALNLRVIAPPYDGSPVYGNNDGNYGFSGGNALEGSRHIDVGVKIQPSNILGYVKADRYQSFMIDGFSITNESGVTYHYGLPVYAWDEENYQEKIDRSLGLRGNRSKKPNAYAYAWHLTTITGPDFVDRNNDNKADANDWGYWVNFEYGKWSNNYIWRNPSEGYHRDEDNEWQNCSMGRKEVYYLNAIRTRSHTALFEKEVRNDGWGAPPEIYNKNSPSGFEQDYVYPGHFNTGGSQSMRLSKIYLLDNALNINPNTIAAVGAVNYLPSNRPVFCNNCELPLNVIDQADLTPSFASNAIRVLEFNYDYSLSKGVANNLGQAPSTNNGKLTLKAVKFKGRGGAQVLPDTKFEYELSSSEMKTQTNVTLTSTSFSTTNGNFEVGEMINSDWPFYAGVITARSLSGGTWTYTLKNSKYTGGAITTTVSTTKNPAYDKNAYDLWGMYKSDFDNATITTNENLGRMTSAISAKSVDAWSLRRIITPLGGTMQVSYESDQYKSVLNDNGSILSNVINGTNGLSTDSKVRLYFSQDYFNIVADQVAVGDEIDFIALTQSTDWLLGWTVTETLDSRVIYPSTPIVVTGINTGDRSIITNVSYVTLYNSPDYEPENPLNGNVLLGKRIRRFGGGLRVTNIAMADPTQTQVSSTSYSYVRPDDGKSYGVSAYEPTVLDITDFTLFPDPVDNLARKEYRKALYSDIGNLLTIARELPAPGVMYEYVTVSNTVKNGDEEEVRTIEGKVQYQFEVFRENMVGRVDIGLRNEDANGWGTFTTHNLAIKKFTGSIGNIRRVVLYDKDGRKMSELINHNLHDGLETMTLEEFMDAYKLRLANFSYQGYLQERFSEVKVIDEQGFTPNSKVKATLSAREEYPCIPTGQTIINYTNGNQSTTEYLAYDFYSGEMVKSAETDAYGNRFMTEIVPAYRKYPWMGLKTVGNGNNKSMLSQVTGTHIYKVDASNNKLGLVAAQVQTWSNTVPSFDKDGNPYVQSTLPDGNVWRIEANWSWLPITKTNDGLTPIADFPASADFNWTAPTSSDPRWKKTSEITRYDVYSKALEEKDLSGNYSAQRLNYGFKKTEFTASPAKFHEIAFSGAEDIGVFQTNNMFVKNVNGLWMHGPATAHTGDKSLKIGTSGQKGFVYTVNTNDLTIGRTYKASAWVRPVSGTASDVRLFYDINGTVKDVSVSSGAAITKSANGWYLINLIIKGIDITPGVTLNVGCRNDHGSVEAYIDDFRFQPINATGTAYVYDINTGELTHVLDNNNLFIKYEYDVSGRLLRTYMEKLNVGVIKTTENEYNMGACVHHSSAFSQVFTKTDCPSGYGGTMVVYTVPQGKYCSAVSQLDANTQASNDLIANGQQYANINGVCVPGGGIIRINATVPNPSPALIVILDAVTNQYVTNAACSNGTSYMNVPPGNYKFQVSQSDGISRTVSIPGYPSQTGNNVTFNSIPINTTQLVITIL